MARNRWSGMSTVEIRAELDSVIEPEAKRLHGQGARTVAEEKRFRDLLDDITEARDEIDRRNRLDEATRSARGVIKVADALRVQGDSTERGHPDATEVLAMQGQSVRSAALRLLDARHASIGARSGDQVDAWLRASLNRDADLNVDGEYLAKRMLITESPEYRSAWREIMTKPPFLRNFTPGEVHALRSFEALEKRAMGEGAGGTGGYGVPFTLDPSIMLTSGASVAPMLDIARVVPVTSNVWKGVSSAPPTWAWATEGTAVADDSPTLAQPVVNVWMTRGFIPYSIEVSQDYQGFAEEMTSLLGQGYLDAVAAATATGSGSTQPYGIITKLDATAGSEILLTTSGTIGAVDVFNAWNALPERFRSRASWFMSVSAESQIRSLATVSTGQATSYFTIDLNSGGLTRLNGRPVYLSDYFSAWTGTTGHANAAIVGDFSNYIVARRIGMSVEQLPMLFQQVTAGSGPAVPTGQRGFFGYARMGADVGVTEAFRLINQT